MCTLSRVSQLLKEQHKTQKELCDYLGIPKSTFTNWKSGLSESYLKYLPQIADFFGVSIDYLSGKTDKKNTTAPTEQPLSLRDKYILSRFDGMSDEEVSKALDYLEKLKNQDS